MMNDDDEPGRPEPYISHYQLNETLERRRKKFTQEDITNRAVRAMKRASKQGVTAMRAQCHVDREVGLKHLAALTRARDLCSEIMTLQIVAFPQQGLVNHPDNRHLFQTALQSGADVMGCAPNLDRDSQGVIDFRAHIDAAFEIAVESGVDLDVHADLGLHDYITAEQLETTYLSQKTIEHQYQGRVTAGHVSALSCTSAAETEKVINSIMEAQIKVVSQPDLYRLGREDTSQARRGLTRVKELISAGVTVSYASNNVRDALRPMGNFDLLEEGLILAYGAHMDSVEELNTILTMSTYNAAAVLGLENYGCEEGCNADLVILNCHNPSEAIIGLPEKLYTIRNGKIIDHKCSTLLHPN
jgi:cytosine deaminase